MIKEIFKIKNIFSKFLIANILFIVVQSCGISKNAPVYKHLYTMELKSEGYSNINLLIQQDSIQKKRASFFNTEELKYVSVSLNCSLSKIQLTLNNDGSYTNAYTIINPILTITNDGVNSQTADLLKQLILPFFCKIDKAGSILSITTDSVTDNITQKLQKEIISRFQFVTTDTNKYKWQIKEENTIGNYTANYKQLNNDSGYRHYLKTIRSPIFTTQNNVKQKTEIDSYNNIDIDSIGQILKINVSETIITSINKDTLSAIGNKLTIAFDKSSIAENTEIQNLVLLLKKKNYSNWMPLHQIITAKKILEQAYKSTLGSNTKETLFKQIELLKPGNKEAEDSLVLKLRAFAWLSAKDCIEIANRLIKENSNSTTFALLSKALSITETTEATTQIARIIKLRKNEEQLVLAFMPILATTKYPTTEAINILKELTIDSSITAAITSTAQLVLGGMAYNLRATDNVKAEATTQFLYTQLLHTTDTIQKLLVLGNTGSASILPLLKNVLSQSSTNVKLIAIGALRFIQHIEVDNLLYQLVISKQNKIKLKAKEIIEFRESNKQGVFKY